MKKMMLYQHGGSYNHGCEALATTISQSVKDSIKEAKVYLCSHHADQDEQYNIESLDHIIQNDRWLKRYTLPWLYYQIDKRTLNNKNLQEKFMIDKPCIELGRKMDCCIAIGGDNYCYNKGKVYWPTERKIKKFGNKMMLWGCSIEPNQIPGELAEHLELFDIITARESLTYQALVENGLGDKTTLVADPAFLLEATEPEYPVNWKKNNMVGINLSPMVLNYTLNKNQVVQSIHRLVEYILTNTEMNIVLIPHVRLSYTDDVEVLNPIYDKFRTTKRVLILDDLSLNSKQLKGYISKCRFFIGARTHSVVAAYSTCIPSLALGYSIKAKGIARDIFGNEKNFVIPVQTFDKPDTTIKAFEYLMKNENSIKDILKEAMPNYKEKAKISGELLMKLMQ